MHIFLRHKYLVLTVLLLGVGVFAQGQTPSSFKIDRISVDSLGMLEFWLKMTYNGRLDNELRPDDLRIIETTQEWTDTLAWRKIDTLVYAEEATASSRQTIMFLLDNSSAVSDSTLDSAKRVVRQVVDDLASVQGVKYYLGTYGQTPTHPIESLGELEITTEINTILKADGAPDFYGALLPTLHLLKAQRGKKTLFIFGSGQNEPIGLRYHRQLPYEDRDIRKVMESLPYDLKLFVIDQHSGSGVSAFRHLSSDKTQFADGGLPADYLKQLEDNAAVHSNLLIKVSPLRQQRQYQLRSQFKGENREYRLDRLSTGDSDITTLRLGSATYVIDLAGQQSKSRLLIYFILGLIGILLLLGGVSLLVPWLRERDFVKRYVVPYEKKAGKTHTDIIHSEPIQAGELVVTKCRQITPFSTWKEMEWQCPAYPECQHFNCSGAGRQERNDFKSMEGVYLKLNWVLFGAIGGFLGWIILSVLSMTERRGLQALVEWIVGTNLLQHLSQNNSNLITQTISNNLLVGIAFGTGLILLLSSMEERRAHNRYSSLASSIGRIALRTSIGTVLGMVVFLLGFYLQYVLGVGAYLSGLLSWLGFGLVVGLVIAFRSSVALTNGLMGGVIGALIAFQIYWFFSNWMGTDMLLANLVSMILMGVVIGSIIVSVVATMEDYELQIIAPKDFQRTIPISKWLKSSTGVTIGKMPGSYIYVKWDDVVKAEHAELFAENEQVFVNPIEEVILNRQLISKPHPLKHGDVIRLGRSSDTEFRFVEK